MAAEPYARYASPAAIKGRPQPRKKTTKVEILLFAVFAVLVIGAIFAFIQQFTPHADFIPPTIDAGFKRDRINLLLIGIATTFVAPEPVLRDAPPKSLAEAVVLPFGEFFRRAGAGRALLVLLFIVLYKYSDSLAGSMTTPFLLKTGFSQSEVGAVFLGAGVIATIVGVLAGGAVIGKLGINKSLWLFVVFQGLSNLTYYFLSLVGKSHPGMVSAVVTENFGLGLVTAGMTAYLMSMCNRRFTATQFALLSSLMAASRDVLVAPAGKIAESIGWPSFFLITVAIAIPPLVLLPLIAPWNREAPNGAASHTGETVGAAA